MCLEPMRGGARGCGRTQMNQMSDLGEKQAGGDDIPRKLGTHGGLVMQDFAQGDTQPERYRTGLTCVWLWIMEDMLESRGKREENELV